MPNPQLAVDWRPAHLQFPCIAQPKIDGVRGGQFAPGKFTGRSLKAFKNKALTKFYSELCFNGIDGEQVVPGLDWTHPAMCRKTTSATNTIDSKIVTDIVLFDFVTPATMELAYRRRYELLQKLVRQLRRDVTDKVHLMPLEIVKSYDRLMELDEQWLDEGYEGTIVRNADAPFKPDRSGNGMELWRIKRHIDFEFRVTKLIEAMENRNEAKTNELGRTERSGHKANKHGKGMIGMIQGVVLKDVVYDGKVLFPKGMTIDVSAGKMNHAEREHYWNHPDEIVGHIGKAKTFPRGVKEKPRMPVWLTFRAEEDL